MYNKLFTKILDSTIWLAPTDQRIVWITFLAAMDEDGFVALSSVDNVAARARVTVDAAASAIQAFEAPDVVDPGQENEGRRIERVPGGWLVLNAEKYREMVTRTVSREANRRRQATWREKQRMKAVTLNNENVTISDTVSVSESESYTPPPPAAGPPQGNGKEKTPKPKRGPVTHFVPEDFDIPEEDAEWAKTTYPSVDLFTETKKFRDCEFKTPHSDWRKAWRNWVRRVGDGPRR